MKNIYFIVLLFAMFALNANAQLVVEDFDYVAGTPLIGQGGWTITGTSIINPLTVTSGGLTYTNYLGSGVGNAVGLANNGQDAYLGFTNQNSGALYASFLITLSATQLGNYFGDYVFHFTQGLITSNAFYARVFARTADNGNITFGISKSSTSATNMPVFTDSIYALNTTYLIVVKYQFNTGTTTDDEASLYVFTSPTLPATEPITPSAGPVTTTQTDATGLDIVNLRQGSATLAPTGTIDAIRVATSWTDAPLPVELSSFTSKSYNNGIQLLWSTASEKNNLGFNIERSADNISWNKIGFVNGSGNSNSTKQYSFNDNDLGTSAKYYYRLKQIDVNGSSNYSNVIMAEYNVPSVFALEQNYPNPFNPSTVISYALPEASNVKLIVYNTLGQAVKVLENGFKEAGNYKVSFSASELSTGTYFYKLEAGNFSQIKKMLLIK